MKQKLAHNLKICQPIASFSAKSLQPIFFLDRMSLWVAFLKLWTSIFFLLASSSRSRSLEPVPEV
jgi:hypothetical protein